jgi:zinc protease
VNRRQDRSTPPPAGPEPDFRPPPFRRLRLDSGLELVLAPRQGVPLVEAALLLPAGGEHNPPDRPGLAALTASLVDEGTRQRSGLELATRLEQLGAALGAYADWDATRIEASALAGNLAEILEVVAEVAREPSFPADEVERLRRQTLAEILRRADHPGRLADRALAAALYADSPFGELLEGTAPSLEAVSREELVGFHHNHYAPVSGHLVLCGEFDPSSAEDLAREYFESWRNRGAAARPAPAAAAAIAGVDVTIVDLPRAPQTELRLGHVGVPRTHPDRTQLGVLNALLGGKFTSRLNLNLRERHGFTYGVSSRFADRRSAGPFVVATSVANDVAGAAAGEVVAELRRLRDEPVGAAELAETRNYLRGVYPYTFQTVSGHLARLSDLALFELPDDHFETALAVIAATSPADVQRLSRAHLRPEELRIAAAGPAAVLAPQLAAFGDVAVVAAE